MFVAVDSGNLLNAGFLNIIYTVNFVPMYLK